MRGFAELYLELVELDYDAFIRAGPVRDELTEVYKDGNHLTCAMHPRPA